MTIWRYTGALIRGAAYIAVFGGLSAFGAAAQEAASFKEDVFPIIELRCLECHVPGGSGYEASGLDLRTYDSLMKGTKHGPVVVPRSAFESNLVAVIDHRTAQAIRMPHNAKKMSKCERFAIRAWINQGARDN